MKQSQIAQPVTQLDTTYRRVLDFRLILTNHQQAIWRNPQTAYQAARHVAETQNLTPGELAQLISNTPQRFGRLNGRCLPLFGNTPARQHSLRTAAIYSAAVHYLQQAEQAYQAEHGQRFPSAA